MTPYNYQSMFVLGGKTNPGRLQNGTISTSYSIRPVISLKSCVNTNNGIGTSDEPYTVYVTNECAAKEN